MFLNKLRITNKQINKIETQNLFTILYQNPYTLVIGTKITSPPPNLYGSSCACNNYFLVESYILFKYVQVWWMSSFNYIQVGSHFDMKQ